MRDVMYQLRAVKKDIADLDSDVRQSVAKSRALIDSNVQKMDYVVEKVSSQTENFNQKLRDYSSKEDTNVLKEELERDFAASIRNLKIVYTPLIETCQRTLRENQQDNADMKEILLKFDKTLATKADRINTIETHKWVTDNFLSLKASDHNTLQANEQNQ